MAKEKEEDFRIVSGKEQVGEVEVENKLRPQKLSDYVGQEKVKRNIEIYIKAAKKRKEELDHVLLYGPPGLGKTTLAAIIANEMEANFKITSGPIIERSADLAAILTGLNKGDVLFIDEIHGLKKSIEEILYSAMEDFSLDFIVGKGPNAKSMRLKLEPFTLIGATTRAGRISSPLRDRFGIIERLEMYSENDLQQIVNRSSKILNAEINDEGSLELAKRGRGTPRIVNRLLKRARDYAEVKDSLLDLETVREALNRMGIDGMGLDSTDLRILKAIDRDFKGGPVGLETLSAISGEDTATIEDMIEPYLLQQGLLNKTPRGRMLTIKGAEYVSKLNK